MSDERRLALADELRFARESAGVSGKQVADRVGWAASKVSRMETGKQPITDSDLQTFADAIDLDRGRLEEWRDELRSIRVEEARWSKQLRTGHRALQHQVAVTEQDASRIRGVFLTLIPGLAQTAEYARAVFTSLAELNQSPRDTDAAVAARMQRQQVLYDSSKTIELLMTEYAFTHPVASSEVMRSQIDRLIAIEGTARLGIIPSGARMPVVMHDFTIRDDTVTIELVNTEVVTSDPADTALFNRMADALWSIALEGERARELLLDIRSRERGNRS